MLAAAGVALAATAFLFRDTTGQSRRDAEAFRIEFKTKHIRPEDMPRLHMEKSVVKKLPGGEAKPAN